jgi:hypothetical protein
LKYHGPDEDDEPELLWDSCYAEPGRADRNIATRNRPDLKPAEERMNIVSNRVIDLDPHSFTNVRLESDLEASAMTILKAMPGIAAIRAQYKVRIMVDGIWRDHWFDLCADFKSGCRVLYAVRNKENAAEIDVMVELFRNQELSKHAHFAVVLTEKEISKPAVYRAEEMLLARKRNNERNNGKVMEALLDRGGHARVADVLMGIKGLTYARGWDALWCLIDRGLVVHDHRQADKMTLQNHSWIRVADENDTDR